MRNINRVVISGNLTRDPEWRGSSQNALALGVAVNDQRRNPQTGEWEDYPNFIDCVVFGNRAEPLSRFLEKGTKVTIEGKLRWSQWERDGQKRSKVEVVVDEIEFSNRKSDAPQRQPQQRPASGRVAAQGAYQPTLGAAVPAQPTGAYDDEIPF